jgi:hypothetical protein
VRKKQVEKYQRKPAEHDQQGDQKFFERSLFFAGALPLGFTGHGLQPRIVFMDCGLNPDFSPAICCNTEDARVCGVALTRPPQHTFRYACVVLPSRALHPLASSTFRDDTW